MNYYERHIGDYLKDTAHLSLLEHGVYGRLLDVYYTREGGIPIAQAERLVGVRSKDERAALATVLDEFFVVDGDALRHARCDREIARYQDKQRKAKASAEARWSHTERNANASPNAMRTHSEGNALQTPVTSNQTPKEKPPTEVAVSSLRADPPTPPPAFDGKNAEALNGKAVVPIAAAWELPEEWGLGAESLGWEPPEVLREAEKFRQYWVVGKGKGTRRSVKSWRQSWSNWLTKAAEQRR